MAGTPGKLADQIGVLSVRTAPRLLNFPEDLIHHYVRSRFLARMLARRAARVGGRLLAQFPDVPRRELDAPGRHRPRPRQDGPRQHPLRPQEHLSPAVPRLLQPGRPGRPQRHRHTLFARNVDFFDLGYLHEFSLVTVRPRTARAMAYATVGFPGVLGCFRG